MRALGVVVSLAACGRVGFDAASPTTDDGSPGGGARSDGTFVRGDVVFTNNVAFVSAPTVLLASLGSLQAADAICQAEANAAALPGTYVAWLSTSTINAIDRIAGSRGWVRTDGMPFVDTPADLVAGRLVAPLTVDATGNPLPPRTAVPAELRQPAPPVLPRAVSARSNPAKSIRVPPPGGLGQGRVARGRGLCGGASSPWRRRSPRRQLAAEQSGPKRYRRFQTSQRKTPQCARPSRAPSLTRASRNLRGSSHATRTP